MGSHSEPRDSAFMGAPQHSGIPDAGSPHSPQHHPPLPLPSSLRVKTTAYKRMAPLQFAGGCNENVVDNVLVAALPLQTANNATTQVENDTTTRCDNNDDSDSFVPAAAAPTTGAAPPAPQLLLPLMPAMIGPSEICAAEVWSKDPNFMMYCYKITPCTHRTPHDWRVCPWAHPNERASRRCPRMFVYASVPCANARSGRPCAKGPACEYSHNVTEYWLHPNRYRAEWCSLSLRCNRRLCFFAHSDAELRSTDASAAPSVLAAPPPVVLQQPPLPQAPYLDLIAHSATSAARLQTRARPAEQHQRQHQQQLPNLQQQQTSLDANCLDMSASTDDARQHEILQLLMTAVAPAPALTATIPQPHATSAAGPGLIRRHHDQKQQQLQQQRQSSVSAVPAFCDLLGAVAPASPAATLSHIASSMPGTGQVYASGGAAHAAPPSKYTLDTSSAELIAAILQSLPTV